MHLSNRPEALELIFKIRLDMPNVQLQCSKPNVCGNACAALRSIVIAFFMKAVLDAVNQGQSDKPLDAAVAHLSSRASSLLHSGLT